MKTDVKNPFPFYRKLLLENKILSFFAFLVLLLGGAALFITHWTITRHMSAIIVDQAMDAVQPWREQLSEVDPDSPEILLILNQAIEHEALISFMVFTAPEGQVLGQAGNLSLSKSFLASGSNSSSFHNDSPIMKAIPVMQSGIRRGILHIGVDIKQARRFATRVVVAVGLLMLLPVFLILVASRAVVRKAVWPLKRLTQVADEISSGNLDPVADFGVRVNCWEIKNCQRPDCKAYQNFKKQCWYVDGTPCIGYEPRFPQKLAGCRTCEVYQLHRGDEIVRLADAFKHMTNVLVESRENLVKSDDYQKRLIRNSFDGIVATDENDVITIFNRVAEELTGYSRENVIDRKSWREFFEEGLEKIMDIPLTHEKERRLRGFAPRESQVRRADGGLVDIRLAGISLFEKGLHLGRVFFFQDLREIKKLREDLILNERMAATGQAAAGISHSVRNILDGLRGGVFIFKQGKRKGDEKKVEMGWDMIERNMEIISDLVKDLLNFAKDRVPEYEECDPAELLKSVVEGAGLNSNDGVHIRIEIDEPARKVRLDRHAFHQCLTSLVRNAAEAVPYDRKSEITLGAILSNGKTVFYVRDNGEGMNPATIEKVKRGMFSTKGSKGTGLGLQVVQKIVNEHKGELKIDSKVDVGTTFRIEIPIENP